MKIKITPILVLAIIVASLFILIGIVYLTSLLLKSIDPLWSMILFSFIIIIAVVYDLTLKKRASTQNEIFYEVTKYLLGDNYKKFESFKNLYQSNPQAFLSKNNVLVKQNDNFDFKNLKSVELLYLFGTSEKIISVTDWKGEENEYEIEKFLDANANSRVWENAIAFRKSVTKNEVRDDSFPIGLLKAIDKDLAIAGHRLLFLDLGWDSYVYLCITTTAYNRILAIPTKFFYSIDRLK